ncbi:MAG: Sec-independent protein translocase protein TatB [Gammaproteobacteria bacterium]
MFDVGFAELCLVGLVSLLVIGPERLPKVARLAGFWLGKTRTMIAAVKEEIKLELQAEEMRQIFKEQSDLHDIQQIFDETSDTLKSTFDQSQLPTKMTPESEQDMSRQSSPDNAEQNELK